MTRAWVISGSGGYECAHSRPREANLAALRECRVIEAAVLPASPPPGIVYRLGS